MANPTRGRSRVAVLVVAALGLAAVAAAAVGGVPTQAVTSAVTAAVASRSPTSSTTGDGAFDAGPLPSPGSVDGLRAVAARTADPEQAAATTPSPPQPPPGAGLATTTGARVGQPGGGAPTAAPLPRGTAGSGGHLAIPGSRSTPGISFPPDGTPLAAAAGSEPGSMQPVDLRPGWSSSVHHLSYGGLIRSYLTVRPSASSRTPLPVLVVLHGRGLTPAAMERMAHLWQTTGPAIQVYPAGYGRSWDAGGCCGQAFGARVDDVGFLRVVVHSVLSSQHDADAARVYAVGFSNGGRMAYRLACDEPGTFAAIVAVEAVPVDQCGSTKPLPVLIVANRHDPLLTIDVGMPPKYIADSVEPTVEAEVERWRTLDGCSPGDVSATDGKLRIETYDNCAGTGRVTFAEYSFGGHDWSPGGPSTPSADTLAWAFLGDGELTTPGSE